MNYTPVGVCARNIEFEIENGLVKSIDFTGGCNGNLGGISSLIVGMKVEDVIQKLEGVDCKGRGTSCPDQISIAFKKYLAENPSN